jgi:DNA-binding PucR family transcriptional regulator
MSVLLNELYKSVVNQFSIKLVAGESGLSNVVKWVHMVENKEISSFLDGQEIVFTTGVSLKTTEDLLSLIKDNVQNRASGMVVNVGPYIKEVTEEIIDYCNQVSFPLFVVPWHVKMARIIKIFCSLILEAEKNEVQLASAVRNAIFSPEQTRLYLPILEESGFRKNSKFCIAIVKLEERLVSKEMLENIKRKIEFILGEVNGKAIAADVEDSVVILLADISKDRIKYIMEKVQSFLSHHFQETAFHVAFGQEVISQMELVKSYLQACHILKVNRVTAIGRPVTDFSEIGAYKVLLGLENHQLIEEYIQETIDPLLEYDKLNKTDYMKVLSLYLHHNGRVNEVASKLFVHRNTVNYKLKRIEELLACDLSDFFVRLNLAIAIMLKELT